MIGAGSRRPALPARISIPAAGVATGIDPVRAGSGGIEVPPPSRAGWFEGGPRPGEPGRAVVIGHLDSRSGPAAFTGLPSVTLGAIISIIDRDGRGHRFKVTGTQQVKKSNFPSGAVYGPARRRLLVLVTCGGPYEPGIGYRDNVLIYARARNKS